ncbi:unnamed protein product [Rotaria sordida]|uniref:Uncharacterized protein n=1 Tax=Rotaria sordida TaxID=392033 RepID=A0A819GXP6_9BILA|nr:unnamed protein product [Rotaria sordida]CAF3886732.1 unnamed protein product [Rotaria sordida]
MAMTSTTTRLVTDGSSSGITGSTVEGQAYARHVINQRDQDIDMMIVEGSIDSADTLIPTGIPGFVQIKIAGVQATSDTQLKSNENGDGILCVNGLEMKRTYPQIETGDVGPLSKEELNRCTNEPLWGESANKCSPSEFVNGLMGIIFYLKAINEAMNDPQFTGQYIDVNPRTFQSYQNVMQDMTNPENLMQNLLTKLVPMLVDDPEKISSLIERTLLVDHPGGPLLNFVQHTSIASRNEQHEPSHHPTIMDTIRTLESVPDPNMTVAELNEHQSRVKNQRQQEADLEEADDQLLALAIQKSLEEF